MSEGRKIGGGRTWGGRLELRRGGRGGREGKGAGSDALSSSSQIEVDLWARLKLRWGARFRCYCRVL